MSKSTRTSHADLWEQVRTGTVAYDEIPASEVPARLRWDTPGRNRGQMTEVSYAEPGARGEAGYGDLYKRVTDTAARSVTYYKRA